MEAQEKGADNDNNMVVHVGKVLSTRMKCRRYFAGTYLLFNQAATPCWPRRVFREVSVMA